MYKKHGAVIAALLLLVLFSSASALVVNDTQTWTGTINIDALAGGVLEIGPSGNLTMTAHVNFEGWPGRRLSIGTFAIQAHDPKSLIYVKDIRVRVLK